MIWMSAFMHGFFKARQVLARAAMSRTDREEAKGRDRTNRRADTAREKLDGLGVRYPFWAAGLDIGEGERPGRKEDMRSRKGSVDWGAM